MLREPRPKTTRHSSLRFAFYIGSLSQPTAQSSVVRVMASLLMLFDACSKRVSDVFQHKALIAFPEQTTNLRQQDSEQHEHRGYN